MQHLLVFSRRGEGIRAPPERQRRRRVGEAAADGGQEAGQGVEGGGHPSGTELQSAGRHPGSGEGRDHAEAEDAGAVEEQEAAGGGHVAAPVERPPGHG